jgi:uncharacterized membrane-anchored protein
MRPRVWLAAILVCLLQTGAIAALIVNRAIRLTHGREIVLAVVPVDPRDLLRGDYVRLGYAVSQISTSLAQLSWRQDTGRSIFVTLERQGQPEDGNWVAVGASPEPPAMPEGENKVVLRGTMNRPWSMLDPNGPYGNAGTIHVTYGIESYFVPENTGGDLERAARARAVKAVISVDRDGNAVIKGMIVNGIRHDETLL